MFLNVLINKCLLTYQVKNKNIDLYALLRVSKSLPEKTAKVTRELREAWGSFQWGHMAGLLCVPGTGYKAKVQTDRMAAL